MTAAAAPKGDRGSVPCIAFTHLLPGPIERVWAQLTEMEKLPA